MCLSFLLLLLLLFTVELISIVPVVFFRLFFLLAIYICLFVYLFICHLLLSSSSLLLFLFHSVNCINVCVRVFFCISTDYSLEYSFHSQTGMCSTAARIKRCAHLQQFVFFGILLFFFLLCFHCEYQRVVGSFYCWWFFSSQLQLFGSFIGFFGKFFVLFKWERKKVAYLKGKKILQTSKRLQYRRKKNQQQQQ